MHRPWFVQRLTGNDAQRKLRTKQATDALHEDFNPGSCMGRPVSNDANLTLDEIKQLQQLFGTSAHAYRTLLLQGQVTPYVFSRIWRWDGAKEEVRDVIRRHFNIWKMKYLKDPFEDSFVLQKDDILTIAPTHSEDERGDDS